MATFKIETEIEIDETKSHYVTKVSDDGSPAGFLMIVEDEDGLCEIFSTEDPGNPVKIGKEYAFSDAIQTAMNHLA